MTRKGVDPAKLWAVASAVSAKLVAAGVPHALIGGLAVSAHGYERATADVDFLVSEEDLGKLTGRPLTIGLTERVDGIRVDYIIPDPPDAEVLADAIAEAERRGTMPVIDGPSLVYLKLRAGRRRDEGDVVELVKRGKVDVAAVRAFLDGAPDPDYRDAFDALVLQAEQEAD